MKALRWAEQTRLDLYEIADHHEAGGFGDGDDLLEQIYEALLVLCDFPFLGEPAGHADVRKWRLKGTPFLIFYRVLENAVEVVRVVHAASDWANEV